MTQETMGDETYIMKTLLDFLGISRSTLRYYEQLGIVRPGRNERSNYRSYSVDDIYRVAGCFMLKNAGYAVQDAPALFDRAGAASSFVKSLEARNEGEIAWHLAMRDALKRQQRVCQHAVEQPFKPRLVYVDTWLAYYDKGETSYKNFDPDDTMAALLRGMPVTSFGSVFDGELLEGERQNPYRSFRCVPERYAHLIPELAQGLRTADDVFGGCPCVVVSNLIRYEDIALFSSPAPYRAAIQSFLKEKGLKPVYPAFAINAWPTVDAIYSEVNLPVRATSLHGRALLHKVAHGARSGESK